MKPNGFTTGFVVLSSKQRRFKTFLIPNLEYSKNRGLNMTAWRLLKLEAQNPPMNMAIDEAILTARTIDRVPNTLRLYKWKPSGVSIGRNQNIENEAQLNNCRKLGVQVVRRISGGGTVYHD